MNTSTHKNNHSRGIVPGVVEWFLFHVLASVSNFGSSEVYIHWNAPSRTSPAPCRQKARAWEGRAPCRETSRAHGKVARPGTQRIIGPCDVPVVWGTCATPVRPSCPSHLGTSQSVHVRLSVGFTFLPPFVCPLHPVRPCLAWSGLA